jgi:hypothetical protein
MGTLEMDEYLDVPGPESISFSTDTELAAVAERRQS